MRDETLVLTAILAVKDGEAYSENSGESYPVQAFMDPDHEWFQDAIGSIGGPDLAVIPWWPALDFGFGVNEVYLSADGTRLIVEIQTDLTVGEYLDHFTSGDES